MTTLYVISFNEEFKIVSSKSFILDINIEIPNTINLKGIFLNGNNIDLINLFELVESDEIIRTELNLFFESNINYFQSMSINNTIITPNIHVNINKNLKYPKYINLYLDNCIRLFNETFADISKPFQILSQINNWQEIVINEYIDELNEECNKIILYNDSEKLSIMSSNFSHNEKLIKLSKISNNTYKEINNLFQEIKLNIFNFH